MTASPKGNPGIRFYGDKESTMEDSILGYVKHWLGKLVETTTAFDGDLLGYIMVSMLPLYQVGCIKDDAPIVTSETTWGDIVNPPPNGDMSAFMGVKSFVCLMTKIYFDPPVSTVTTMMKEKADELLWRIELEYGEDREP